MFCPKCGAEQNDDAAFCGSCGAVLNGKPSSTQPNATSSAQPAATPTAQQAAPTVAPAQSSAPVASGATSTAGAAGVATQAKQPFKVSKKAVAIGIVVIVLIVAAIVVSMIMGAMNPLGQNEGTFRKAFETQKPYDTLFSASSYLTNSPAEIESFSEDGMDKVNDQTVTCVINTTVANDNIKAIASYNATYRQSSQSSNGTYTFELKNVEYEAITGITADPNNDLVNIEAELSEDGTSCTVVESETFDLWFADSSLDTTYKYKFNKAYGSWSYDTSDVNHVVTYKDMDGTYTAKSGDLLDLSNFTISSLDADNGSFTITCTRAAKTMSYSTNPEVKATFNVTLDPEAAHSTSATGREQDGYIYRFESKGSTDSGNKNANITGYITQGDGNAPAIYITRLTMDGVTNYEHSDKPNNTSFNLDGMLYKG